MLQLTAPRRKTTRRHSNDETFSLFLMGLTIALLLCAPSIPTVRGAQQFEEAQIFFELNHTDGDLGIHASIDGEPWTDLEIEGPGGEELLNIVSHGRLARQAITPLSFESDEPDFEDDEAGGFLSSIPRGPVPL